MVTRQLPVNKLSEIRLYSQRKTGQFCIKITQLQNTWIPYLWYRQFKNEFCWVFIDSSVLKRHAWNRPLPLSQTAEQKESKYSYVWHWLFYTVIRQVTMMTKYELKVSNLIYVLPRKIRDLKLVNFGKEVYAPWQTKICDSPTYSCKFSTIKWAVTVMIFAWMK